MSFGPGDLIYEMSGDLRGYLLAPVVGMFQLMYPQLGRGVEEHSAFYTEPFERIIRSLPQIQRSAIGGSKAQAAADSIRELHRDIKGTMPDGTRYHALDPETFFWAHATFLDAPIRNYDLFDVHPLTMAQREAHYREGIRWWQSYGLSMRPVPPTYRDFLEYWNRTLTHDLEFTPAARGLADFIDDPTSMKQPWLPDPIWRLVSPGVGLTYREVLVGAFPPNVREILGLKWTRRNQIAFDAFRNTVARVWPLLPRQVRIAPEVRALQRKRGRVGMRKTLATIPS